MDSRFRRFRGALRNALVWGAGFAIGGFGVFTVLKLAGVFPKADWIAGAGLAARMGIVGFVAGGAFATIIRLVYHGRRLRDIKWARFAVAGGVVTGVFVPLFLQTMNLLTEGHMVPWRLVLDDALWATVFGWVAAGATLKLAQRAEAVAARKGQDQLDRWLPGELED